MPPQSIFNQWIGLCIVHLITILCQPIFANSNQGLKSNGTAANNWGEYINFLYSVVDVQQSLVVVREMFDFAYTNYINHAFPLDELNPILCSGRGHDHTNPDNFNVNDALGDYLLTLIDSLDTLAMMGKNDEFKSAVQLVIKHLSFDKNVRVQVFEATIRVMGGLLSAHLLITDPRHQFGDLRPTGYNDDLLHFAHDLATRLVEVFDKSPSGLPYPRVNLSSGIYDNTTSETCLAGAGSLLLEFGCLSALLNDPLYASLSKRVVMDLWQRRSSVTGLLGSTIDVNTGRWKNTMSGLGAGQDSFYEYLHKTYVLFGDTHMNSMFSEALGILRYHLRSKGSPCLTEDGKPPIYWNVDMYTGEKVNYWIDSLQSMWSAVLVHHGDLEEAVCQHAIHYFIWQLYDLPPERYNVYAEKPQVKFYPLRPEFIESTYFLYRATKHPFYLHVGKKIMDSFNTHCRARCGFATIHDVLDKSQEDRMESFFLSETLKYLYILFDESNPVNRYEEDYIFSTQAHIFPIKRIRSLVEKLKPNPFHTYPVNPSPNLTNSCLSHKLPKTVLPMEKPLWEKIGKFVHQNSITS